MANDDVIFRRVKGRIIPIKTKRSRKPKKRKVAKMNKPHWVTKETVGAAIGGGIVSGFGIASMKTGEHFIIKSSKLRKKSKKAFELAKRHKLVGSKEHIKRGEKLVIKSKALRIKSEKLFKVGKMLGGFALRAKGFKF